MNISAYLIVSPGPRKYSPKVKLQKNLTTKMPANAVAIKINLELPDAIFQKPQLQATIKIKDEDISKPVINAQTLDNIKKVLSQEMGIDLTVNVIEPKK